MTKYIGFAGGCFWGVESYFKIVNGVLKTRVGYSGGFTDFPTYKQVCGGKTGHTETCAIVYDSTKTDLETLLEHFFFIIDPTEVNKQGYDIGTQYRSAVFYYDIEDKEVIENYIDSIASDYDEDIATEILPMIKFWDAELYHQNYLGNNPGSYCHIDNNKFQCASKIDTLSYLKNKAKKLSNNNNDNKNYIEEKEKYMQKIETEEENYEPYEEEEPYAEPYEDYKEENGVYNCFNNDYLGENFVYQKKLPYNYKFSEDSEDEEQQGIDLIFDFKNKSNPFIQNKNIKVLNKNKIDRVNSIEIINHKGKPKF